MNIKQLTYFSAVYELNNLSHAANRFNVAQSAISHHISKLEAALGVSLFNRKPRGMEPTAAGNRLYLHAQKILNAIKDAEQDMLPESNQIAGSLAIGLPFSVMRGIGLPLMETILKDYPDVRLSIVESLSGNTFSSLVSSEIDLALFYNPLVDDRVTMETVLEEQVLCVGKKEIIGESNSAISFEELSTLPVLLLRQGVSLRALVDKPGLLSRLETNSRIELNSVSGITNGLLAGLGCTISPKIFIGEHLESGALHARPVRDPELTRRLFIGYRRDYPSNRLFEAIKNIILELIHDKVKAGSWEARYLRER